MISKCRNGIQHAVGIIGVDYARCFIGSILNIKVVHCFACQYQACCTIRKISSDSYYNSDMFGHFGVSSWEGSRQWKYNNISRTQLLGLLTRWKMCLRQIPVPLSWTDTDTASPNFPWSYKDKRSILHNKQIKRTAHRITHSTFALTLSRKSGSPLSLSSLSAHPLLSLVSLLSLTSLSAPPLLSLASLSVPPLLSL